MSALESVHLCDHHDADTIIVTRMTPGASKAAKEPVVDIQASSAQQDLQAAPGLPLFDLSEFLLARDGPSAEQDTFCEEMASCLQQTGCLIVRDPRVSSEQSDCFLDMMERYFSQPTELKMPDVHPELHYQVCLLRTDLKQRTASFSEQHHALDDLFMMVAGAYLWPGDHSKLSGM